jgi:hypothetical protein
VPELEGVPHRPSNTEERENALKDRRATLILTTGMILAGSALAQSNRSAARLRGKVDAVTGHMLSLTLRNGTKATAKLPAELRVT